MKKREIVVNIDDKKVVVKKLAIGKYSELFLALQNLPKHVKDLDKLDNDSIVERLPELLASATPDVIEIVSIAVDMPKDEVEELGLDEVTDIIVAALEVNDYEKIIANIKKIMARKQPEAVESQTKNGLQTGSTEQ